MKKLLCVIGTRPQMIKHLPFQVNCDQSKYHLVNLHTGQHSSDEMKLNLMSEMNPIQFKSELTIGSMDRESRMVEMTNYIARHIDMTNPDMVIVYGDTDSTLAGAYAAEDKRIPLCHIEAGLRSYNSEMPEEFNRIETDKRAQLYFCPSEKSLDNLRKENITNNVFVVGDIMKDSLLMAKKYTCLLKDYKYYYATLHRPYNVDHEDRLNDLMLALNKLPRIVKLSLHPRTLQSMKSNEMNTDSYPNIDFIAPQSYLNNINYMMGSEAVVTDSGGMQKEAYWLEKKCITLRSETEWTETLHNGCNTLVFDNLSDLANVIDVKAGPWDSSLYGDGKTTQSIYSGLDQYFNCQ